MGHIWDHILHFGTQTWDWTKKDILMVEKLDRIIALKVWEQNEILRTTGVGIEKDFVATTHVFLHREQCNTLHHGWRKF